MGTINVPNIIMRKVDELVPYIRNTKLHPPRQVKKIAMSIEQYGFNVPVIIDAKNEIIAGHGRLLAAKELKMIDVPCVCIDHLSTEQVRAFRIADNKVAESEWEAELLEEELKELFSENFDLELTGFGNKELSDILIDMLPQELEKGEEFSQGEAEEYENPYSGKRKEDDLPPEELAMDFWEWLKGMEDIYVMFSGGKDSMAMLACLLDHDVPKEKMIIVHNRTPLDYPGLGEFVEEFARKEGIRIDMIGLKNSFQDTCKIMRKYGFPKSFTTRWCTGNWKVHPLNRYCRDKGIYKSERKVLCQGFRAEEGSGRAELLPRGIQRIHQVRIARPIMKWTKKEVFEAIARHGWTPHPIYKYNERLGCIFCFAIKRDEWTRTRKEDPETFFRALYFVAEGFCSKNVSGDDAKNMVRKMMGLKSVQKQLKDEGLQAQKSGDSVDEE